MARKPPIGLTLDLDQADFDAFGRALIRSREDAAALRALFETADAIALTAGEDNPARRRTALLRPDRLVQLGGAMLVDDYAFAALIREAKAADRDRLVLAVEGFVEAA